MSDAPREKNPSCPCPCDDCPRHGICKECRAYHHSLNQKTCCEKKKDGSKAG